MVTPEETASFFNVDRVRSVAFVHPSPEDSPDPSVLPCFTSLCVIFSTVLIITFGSSPDASRLSSSGIDILCPAMKLMSCGDSIPVSPVGVDRVMDTEYFTNKSRSWTDDAPVPEPESSVSSAASPLCSGGSPGFGSEDF